MTNQEAYEELCRKATAYDKLRKVLQDITVLFNQWTSGDINDGQYHFQMQNLILFGKTLAEVSDDNN